MIRFTLLLPKDNLLSKNIISLIKKIQKQLQDKINLANRKKLNLQPIVAIREKRIVQLIFCISTYTLAIKLNSDWQIAVISRKMYIIDRIVFFAALY